MEDNQQEKFMRQDRLTGLFVGCSLGGAEK
jgi:hypothetical protein